ncbi:hypothetical protein [Candidatus Scalindua japonica]|nr:hypothetical protein [Candidatus Scalindua japonica]
MVEKLQHESQSSPFIELEVKKEDEMGLKDNQGIAMANRFVQIGIVN